MSTIHESMGDLLAALKKISRQMSDLVETMRQGNKRMKEFRMRWGGYLVVKDESEDC